MPERKQGKKQKGSQHWLQVAVNEHPGVVDRAIQGSMGLDAAETINWLSPVAPEYSEYQDDSFLEKLNITLSNVQLKNFWPPGGPVWDGLATTSKKKLLLIETKSHIAEINSPLTGASSKSLDLITQSLNQTKAFLNVTSTADWSTTFYQYTNRLAHLYLLRTLNEKDAFLLNVYFVNDTEMNGPSSVEEWKGAITLLKTHLGIVRTKLTPYIKDVFLDVNDLKR